MKHVTALKNRRMDLAQLLIKSVPRDQSWMILVVHGQGFEVFNSCTCNLAGLGMQWAQTALNDSPMAIWAHPGYGVVARMTFRPVAWSTTTTSDELYWNAVLGLQVMTACICVFVGYENYVTHGDVWDGAENLEFLVVPRKS